MYSYISGRLGGDPEKRITPSGKTVVHFTVAVESGYDKATKSNTTEWYDVSVWENLGNAALSLRKGNRVWVGGEKSMYGDRPQINARSLGEAGFLFPAEEAATEEEEDEIPF